MQYMNNMYSLFGLFFYVVEVELIQWIEIE